MSDLLYQPTPQTAAECEAVLARILSEMQRLNAEMRADQTEIDRLTRETRQIGAHTDALLDQIEAQLDSLQKAR